MKLIKSLSIILISLIFFGFAKETSNSLNVNYTNNCVFLAAKTSSNAVEKICPFCIETSNAWRIGGYLVMALKILVPVALIVMLSVDLAKGAFSDNADNSKMISLIVKRIIAAIVIFMIPTILNLTINLLDDINDVKSDYTNCTECMLNPTGDRCKSLSRNSC